MLNHIIWVYMLNHITGIYMLNHINIQTIICVPLKKIDAYY